jgi:hypothetical protein
MKMRFKNRESTDVLTSLVTRRDSCLVFLYSCTQSWSQCLAAVSAVVCAPLQTAVPVQLVCSHPTSLFARSRQQQTADSSSKVKHPTDVRSTFCTISTIDQLQSNYPSTDLSQCSTCSVFLLGRQVE